MWCSTCEPRAIRAARDVPVVFAISGDPVELGLAKSLARPGGNFTGFTFLSLTLAGKRVELLRQAVPQLGAWRCCRTPISYVPFTGAAQLDDALASVREAKADGMIVFPEGATMIARHKIAQFAIRERLPAMFGWSEYADAGGLMSYGANQREAYVRLASFADKLLRGASTAELPIEQPTEFELVVNLKTAAALGITLPAPVLLLANRQVR